jgi:hypothetical protein
MVYNIELAGLSVYPDSTAIASSVSVVLTVIGPVYFVDDVVGVFPLVV